MRATVTDRFDIRKNLPGNDHDPGLVMVLAGGEPPLGTIVEIPRPDGTTVEMPVLEVKRLGELYTIFVGPALSWRDVSIGTVVCWNNTEAVAGVPAGHRQAV